MKGLTKAGYIRIHTGGRKCKKKLEHVLVWEKHHGPVPKGHELHHKNRIRHDNRLENLQLVDHLTHKRIHSGCELRNGEWWKPCNVCKVMQHISNYYTKHDGVLYRCKKCQIAASIRNKKERKARAKAAKL